MQAMMMNTASTYCCQYYFSQVISVVYSVCGTVCVVYPELQQNLFLCFSYLVLHYLQVINAVVSLWSGVAVFKSWAVMLFLSGLMRSASHVRQRYLSLVWCCLSTSHG
ncbi:hypothetical protein PS15m_012295 [Mucor circinelloides]